jgi:alpha-L-rhamnosidase
MLKLKDLRCEYKENPIGIDVKKPRLSWIIASDRKNVMQTAWHIQVSTDDSNFAAPIWDSGKVCSDNSIHLEYQGPALASSTRYFYRVKVSDNHGDVSEWSEPAFWETGILDCEEWTADFITPDAEADQNESGPCPMLRKDFQLSGEIKSARIHVTSLGLYELRLNGSKVGNDLLTPGWTSYKKRLQYQTYDVTGMLRQGNNAIGALLGDGWYKGNLAWEGNRNIFGNRKALLLQMHVRFADNREMILLSDHTWKTKTGPILASELYHGETYDAGLELPGWDMPGFDDAGWRGVDILHVSKDILVAQENIPVRKMDERKPVQILTTPKGERVLDMGQNMVGWICFKVRGPKDARVVLKHAEVLDQDGNFYNRNLRTAKQTIEYILKGEGVERFEPHFTFQGFRYVLIEEYPGEALLESFTGMVIHSDMDGTGTFECSNELVNKLQHNILWGMKGNFVDIPTDCPQRDERLGWTGDAQVFARTASYNMNTALFFQKWLNDLKADQLDNGGVPHVVPQVLKDTDHSSSGWGDAAVICPWTIYLCFGDKRILSSQYESMKSWVEYIRAHSENGLVWNSGFHFGDWLALDSKEGSYFGATPNDLISTAFYAYSAELLARSAKILQKNDDAKKYSELHSNIVAAFRNEFFTPSGRLAVPTQTAHVLALMFDLVAEKDKKRTVDTLIGYIEDNRSHLTTGFLGTPYLCHVLSKCGRHDIACKLLLQVEYPSWLYPVTQGATTIWEHWDGIKPDGSMWSPDMNSFNHYAYGAIGDWLYRVIAGIDTEESQPGYKHILIDPHPGEGLQYASAGLESMYGRITSEWRIKDGEMYLNITVPHNTTATVTLPGARADKTTENGNSVESCAGPDYTESDKGLTFNLGSGQYSFCYRI